VYWNVILKDWKMTDNVLAKLEWNYGVWKMTDHFLRRIQVGKNIYLHDKTVRRGTVSAEPAVLLPAHDIVGVPYCRISASSLLPTEHTAIIFSNWRRTWSASGLTGVLSVQIASVLVIIGRGWTTSLKVTILACVGRSENSSSPPELVQLLNALIECHRRQHCRLAAPGTRHWNTQNKEKEESSEWHPRQGMHRAIWCRSIL